MAGCAVAHGGLAHALSLAQCTPSSSSNAVSPWILWQPSPWCNPRAFHITPVGVTFYTKHPSRLWGRQPCHRLCRQSAMGVVGGSRDVHVLMNRSHVPPSHPLSSLSLVTLSPWVAVGGDLLYVLYRTILSGRIFSGILLCFLAPFPRTCCRLCLCSCVQN